jgi:predicted phosphodiesterase
VEEDFRIFQERKRYEEFEDIAHVVGEVEKKACNSVEKGEVLIFGHTHKPFINTKENAANAGSWVKDLTPSNTYLEIKAGKISLKVFGGKDITERLEC